MTHVLRDLRHAVRSLRSAPGFAAVALLTIALGIAGSTAVFSVVHAVLVRPLPFADPERLVRVRERAQDQPDNVIEVSHPDFQDLRRETRSFTDLAAMATSVSRFVWTEGADPEPVTGALVSGNLFGVLGAQPLAGRTLLPADDVAGAERVVVLGEGVWRRRFGGDPDVVGRRVLLNAEPVTVVGVMPGAFEIPLGAELWAPIVPAVGEVATQRQVGFLELVGRLRPGITTAGALADLASTIERVIVPNLPPNLRVVPEVTPLRDELVGDVRRALLILLAAAGLVLLVACVNVAGLLLARGAARRREISVRAALGASTGRLARQLLVEGVVLAGAGAAIGVAAGAAGVRALVALAPGDLYGLERVGLNVTVLAVSAAATIACALVFAAVPALQAWRGDLVRGLHSGGGRATGGRGTRRAGAVLVAAQVALAALLLVGAGLLVRSLDRLQHVELGFARDRVLTLEVFLPETGYADPAAAHRFYDRLVERAEALPGVRSAAGVLVRPLEGPEGFDYPFTAEGQPPDEQRTNPLLNYEAVTPGYFRAAGVPLVRGRGFTAADGPGAPGVVVLSRSLAERLWPGTDAVGRRLKFGGPDSPAPWLTVVGVAGDARYRGLRDVTLDVYVPHPQSPWGLNHLIVRTSGDPAASVAALDREVRALEPRARTLAAATVEDLVDTALRGARFQTLLLGAFGGVALLLGSVGLYGATAYAASRRIPEMGVRLALGARRRDVRRLVLRQALLVALVGIAAGLLAALAGGRLVSGLLFGVSATDPLTFAVVPAVLGVAALVAGWVPARRAARLDPLKALRTE